MQNLAVSAYVPSFNSAQFIEQTIRSIREQSIQVNELFVIDDGSMDDTKAIVENLGVQVFRNESNSGRGAVRAQAMRQAKNEFVLSCDAGCTIPPYFLERAIKWFDDTTIAAVHYSGFDLPPTQGTLINWRNRHLFKIHKKRPLDKTSGLVTGAILLRKSVALKVGNFNESARYAEDADLGARLHAAGYLTVRDPELNITDIRTESLFRLMDRYWRWNHKERPKDLHIYLKVIWHSMKVMVREDIEFREFSSIPISLLSPHYRFFRSLFEIIKNKAE